MKFLSKLEGPELKSMELKPLSLHRDEDVRSTGFQPQPTMQPTTQWFAMPSPDGTDTLTPFRFGKATASANSNRRFGPNDQGSSNQ